MGIAGHAFFCPSREPKTPEGKHRLEPWLREARENMEVREAEQGLEEAVGWATRHPQPNHDK